jgi:hypothetical protein
MVQKKRRYTPYFRCEVCDREFEEEGMAAQCEQQHAIEEGRLKGDHYG